MKYAWPSASPHCKKKPFFVLATRQKIPLLRTEKNPDIDTRTICLPPIEFFKILHKKLRPEYLSESRDTVPLNLINRQLLYQ
jgi:hypothetical protein